MAQKAVEMGAGTLRPVFTRFTQGERIKLDRLRANAIEAAEQCGILAIPDIAEPVRLPTALDALEPERLLVFCDEDAPSPTRSPPCAARQAAPRRSPCWSAPRGAFTKRSGP